MAIDPQSGAGFGGGKVAWTVPAGWKRIDTVDLHTEGEPLRVILAGFPDLEGDTVLERRRTAREEHDALRRALMWEPRGHPDMYGCLVMPPVTREADFSVLFLHNEGYSTMCGHGIIGVTKLAVESGWVGVKAGEPVDSADAANGGGAGGASEQVRVSIDTPAGLVRATAGVADGRVGSVRFLNVASFVAALDRRVNVEGLGTVSYDLAFGGAFYAYVDAEALGLSLAPPRADEIIAAGKRIKDAVADSDAALLAHPGDADLGFLYGTVFTGPAERTGRHSRHVCVFADGELDRSPTGTAVSGRLAILYCRGEVAVGEEIVIESILGSRFTGRIANATSVGGRSAVVPEVGGRAYVTGRHQFVLDPEDPWREGFLVR